MRHEHRKQAINGEGYEIGIVRSVFNEEITTGLLAGCLRALRECGVREENVGLLEVPGSFELPIGARRLLEKKQYDAVVCLGAIIKGETRHDEYIAMACSQGITDVALKYDVPVLFGVLTTLNIEQALARSSDNDDNKGYEAAMAAVELLNNLK